MVNEEKRGNGLKNQCHFGRGSGAPERGGGEAVTPDAAARGPAGEGAAEGGERRRRDSRQPTGEKETCVGRRGGLGPLLRGRGVLDPLSAPSPSHAGKIR